MTSKSNIIVNRIDFRPGSGGTEGICCIMKLTISFWLILISPTNQESMNQRGPFAQTGKQWVGNDKAHCEPSDEVKTNQWVCALAL